MDRALSTLGRRLGAGGQSERLQHSRLLLTETLLSRRDNRPIGDDLFGLPLLRAIKLPEDREEAWSIADLRRGIENRRVFASQASEVSGYDDTDGIQSEGPSDPKRAVIELSKALGEAVWFVSGDAVASVADVPWPTPEALADAVLRTERFGEPGRRTSLLERLATRVSDDANVRLAARALLAGRAVEAVGRDTELFHGRAEYGQALHTLLSLLDQSWRAVQGNWVESISQDLANALSVSQADLAALHRILDDCLEQPLDWTVISDREALHLLQLLYSAAPEYRRRWCRMPLHRGVDGIRGAIDHRARRSTGRTDELGLPPELQEDVRLLDPDSKVAHLYDFILEMDRDGFLQLMLEDSRPWRFAKQIIHSIRPSEGPVLLPQHSEVRNLLRCRRWLPQRDGGALAPDAVLIAPKELQDAVAGLATAGAFGVKRLPEAVDSGTWGKAEPVVREILGRLGRERQVQRMIDALDSDQVGQVDRGAWLVMPDPMLVNASLIACALETTLADSHPGWKLVRTVKNVLPHGGTGFRDDSESLVQLARVLCAPVPSERQIEMLTRLAATRPAKDSPGGLMFRRLLACFSKDGGFFTSVLPKLDLPTQDGNWHASREVARSETGVARRHRLISELWPILQLGGDDPVTLTSHVGDDRNGSSLETLEKYFESWRDRLPHGAVGAFLSLLGSGLDDVIEKLAEQWLGEDISIEGMRSKLVGPSEQDPCADVSVWVSPRVADGDRVSTVNVLGSWVEMEAEPDDDTLFAIDPIDIPPRSMHFRRLAPSGRSLCVTSSRRPAQVPNSYAYSAAPPKGGRLST